MDVLITCKNEEDPIKMMAIKWPQHYISIVIDAQGQLTPLVIGQWSFLDKVQTRPSFNAFPLYLQE